MIKKLYQIRRFLNSDLTMPGFIASSVTYDEWRSHRNKKTETISASCDATISISDCSRSITLSFDAGTPNALAHSLRKIDMLITVLTDTRAALERADAMVQDKRAEQRAIKETQ